MTPVLRLKRLQCPDDFGRLAKVEALMLDFDYGGVMTDGDDERQFVRIPGPGGPNFVKRDAETEAAAAETLRQDGFTQMRVMDGKSAKGRRVYVFRGPEAGERWHRFVTERVPALQSLGFRSLIEGDFGPRIVEHVGSVDVRIADEASGEFSLDFGIEIDGVRQPLLPILSHLLARGGMAAAQVVGEDLITTLEDGRVVKLPAERIRRMLAIMGDLIEAAGARPDGTLLLAKTEAPTVLELEDLIATRWQNAGAISAYAERFRTEHAAPHALVPKTFKAELRPYQQHGVDWLQDLMAHGLGAFLADDMGLGKTAQTIAHITIEHAAGRLNDPALVVVPTSLITNWTAELTRFAPHLRIAVLHGAGTVTSGANGWRACTSSSPPTRCWARDVAVMRELPWHLIVLDEAQAIKSPEAKGHARRVPARSNPAHLPLRHAHRKQSRRTLVPIRLHHARPARRPSRLCQTLQNPHRKERRSGASRTAHTPDQAVHTQAP